MIKYATGGCALVALLVGVAPTLATINPEDFSADGYVPGNALSDWYWMASGQDTSGALDISGIPFPGEREVTLTADGADAAFPTLTAKATGWGGPGREGGVAGPLWFSVDILKGTGDGQTSMTDFVWSLAFDRQNGANILTLDGGLGTVRAKASQNGGAIFPSPAFDLANGWNRVILLNDNSQNPNAKMYLNGDLIWSGQAAAGPLTSNTTNTYATSLSRVGRGGPDDHFVGTMQFDNIITANEPLDWISPRVPEPASAMLMILGALPMLRRRRPN